MPSLRDLRSEFQDMHPLGASKKRRYPEALKRKIIEAAEIYGTGKVTKDLGLGCATIGRWRSAGLGPQQVARSSLKRAPVDEPSIQISRALIPAARATVQAEAAAVVSIGQARIEVFSRDLIQPLFDHLMNKVAP